MEKIKIVINERAMIEADAHNWTLHYHPEKLEHVATTDKDGRAREKWTGIQKYYSTVQGALAGYIEMETRHMGSVQPKDLLDNIASIIGETCISFRIPKIDPKTVAKHAREGGADARQATFSAS